MYHNITEGVACNMVKIIKIPKTLDFTHDSYTWHLLKSSEFSRLRSLGASFLDADDLDFLRQVFERFTCLTDEVNDRFFVQEGEPISNEMMEKAAYDLSRLMMEYY